MYCDIPELKRCCFCIPLRYGLIACGYLKLMVALAIIILNSPEILWFTLRDISVAIAVIIIINDIIFTTVFLVGCHAKKPKPLLIYMWYNILLTVAFIILHIVVVASVYTGQTYIINWQQFIPSVLLSVVFQAYLIFSIRSEIIKLVTNKEEAVEYTLYDSGKKKPTQFHLLMSA